MKYIPADKLITKIVELRKELPDTIEHLNDEERGFARGQQYELNAIEAEILCLQQEKPETSNNLVDVDAVREDFIREVYRVLDADPTNDRANAIIDAFDSLPTVSQEQPEMDLDAIVDEAFDKYSSVDGYSQLTVSFNRAELYSFIKKIARKEDK